MAFDVPADLMVKIDETITHYPVSKRSATLPLLHLVQEHFGHVSDEAIKWIAAKLELQPINVLELVTFYPMFRREPIGKHHIKVCRTLSCALGGSHELCHHIKERLNLDSHEHGPVTTADGKFTVEYVECIASCGTAPVVMIDDDLHEGVTSAQMDEMIKKLS